MDPLHPWGRVRLRKGLLMYLALIAAFAVPGAIAGVLLSGSDNPTETRYAVCTAFGTIYVPEGQIGSVLNYGDGLHNGPCRRDEPRTTTEPV